MTKETTVYFCKSQNNCSFHKKVFSWISLTSRCTGRWNYHAHYLWIRLALRRHLIWWPHSNLWKIWLVDLSWIQRLPSSDLTRSFIEHTVIIPIRRGEDIIRNSVVGSWGSLSQLGKLEVEDCFKLANLKDY